ncbi:1,4-alpha-glucan branching protein GlgB [Deinococcus maricopensis]|uniref:1,4-alpha-glucan branching enzyme GlgB n=1 Tax=Deinococcus maricopensis (strain DSM 21211 / LMG 22137 / NRRL B-23946 / LB-34) TaxID=709986 RepID=E8UA70_DEIML|nr:1,4-alpha-glucan branching protein GlgB [Deinococcus maricopensis]ADV67959.1 1,4-alpha-glucan-branching enzyme [Deinococcus maricopensis DSM 21211]
MPDTLPLTDDTLRDFANGALVRPDQLLGAHPDTQGGVTGMRFAVWAPNAQRVSVIGDFNGWNHDEHPLHRHGWGVWSTFVPHAHHGQLYKYIVTTPDGRAVHKTDPYAHSMELRPGLAARVWAPEPYAWGDEHWMRTRDAGVTRPISVYEVHLGSWARGWSNEFLNYRELAHRIGDHVTHLGYTHVELMGVLEHPFDGSWGYQVTGYYAPTARHGTPEDFKYFVNHLHERGVGVLLDWVPGHFPTDEGGLAAYDGTPTYEYADPRKGYHPDWNTLIFDYGRHEVAAFLIGSALSWLQDYHIDGLRVDAVASMLHLDFSRRAGEWLPNGYGGNHNLEAIWFLKRFNDAVHHLAPGTITIAEESTSFPGVTSPTPDGLGFDYKWAMGWMNDTLAYFEQDPIYRQYAHHKLTFFNVYRTSERYMLPISHDEVVHLKKSLVEKMPGDWWQRRAGLRAFLALQWATPGKKLLFMGQEFAQTSEWNHDASLPWHLTAYADHADVMTLVRNLNFLYRGHPALHCGDHHEGGMRWINADDAHRNAYAFARRDPGGQHEVIVVANLSAVPMYGYGVRVDGGAYRAILNSDDPWYGGGAMPIGDLPVHDGHLFIDVPPHAVIYLERA